MGGGESNNQHYKFNGSSWTSLGTIPYVFYYGSAVVYNGEIHILGSGNRDNKIKHYKFNGSSWTSVSTLPYELYYGSAVVCNGDIHIMGGNGGYTNHYKFDGLSWTSVSTLPYMFGGNQAIMYNDSIYILGSVVTQYSGNYCLFTSSENMFEPYTIVMQRGDIYGIYLTCFVSVPEIIGDHNKFLSGFDDIWYFGKDSFEMTDSMYYGNGTEWVKFKN